MKMIILKVCLLIIWGLLFLKPCLAAQPVDLYFFYGQGCPICAQAEVFLGELSRKYPDLKVKSFEVFYNQENKKVYLALGQAYNLNLSQIPVPVILIAEKSFTSYNSGISSTIEQAVIKCLSQGCISPIEKLEHRRSAPSSPTNYESKRITNIGWLITVLVIGGLVFLSIKILSKKQKSGQNHV